jgi:hypothetical protein
LKRATVTRALSLVPQSATAERRFGTRRELSESLVATGDKLLTDESTTFRFGKAVEHSKDEASEYDRRDINHSGGELKLLQVGENLISAAILAELLARIRQFHSGEILTPFVVERAILPSAVHHPEAATVEEDSVARHVGSRSIRLTLGLAGSHA